MMQEDDRSFFEIITSRTLPHCARGPKRCDECAVAAKEIVHCLLKVYEGPGMVTRPMVTIERNGIQGLFEYDLKKRFSTLEEAKRYAQENGLEYLEMS
ncbi:MAG: hypothetical protein KAQ65_07755 [Candidatus Thorarchaeota archaeon]|nr:hypothetical protein [Candidatus Thorarchaeota archaeon]